MASAFGTSPQIFFPWLMNEHYEDIFEKAFQEAKLLDIPERRNTSANMKQNNPTTFDHLDRQAADIMFFE